MRCIALKWLQITNVVGSPTVSKQTFAQSMAEPEAELSSHSGDEVVFESDPAQEEEGAEWSDLTRRIDPEGLLKG